MYQTKFCGAFASISSLIVGIIRGEGRGRRQEDVHLEFWEDENCDVTLTVITVFHRRCAGVTLRTICLGDVTRQI